MKLFLIILSFLFFTNCSYINTKYADNEIETSSVVTVKPKVINESAFENFYMSDKLEKELKSGAYRHWRYIKSIAGNGKKQFEKNIPSDKQIDRLQIVRYPAGGGELRDHVDSRKNQRVVTGVIMSKIGEDFLKGGFYFKSSKTKKNIPVEKNTDIKRPFAINYFKILLTYCVPYCVTTWGAVHGKRVKLL